MELLLIRHALPVRTDSAPGGADPDLAAAGSVQADRLALWWSDGLDAVWTSPMLRARQTAAPLATAAGRRIRTDDDLAEMDRHSNTYVPLEELRQDATAWAKAVEDWVGPAGVTMRREFRTRVVSAIDAIVAAHRGHRVAVVCHGGVINAYLAEALGLEQSLFFEPGYASLPPLDQLLWRSAGAQCQRDMALRPGRRREVVRYQRISSTGLGNAGLAP